MDVMISEMDSLLGPSQGRAAPGIIGSRFFTEHVVELDFASNVIHVHDPKSNRPLTDGDVRKYVPRWTPAGSLLPAQAC